MALIRRMQEVDPVTRDSLYHPFVLGNGLPIVAKMGYTACYRGEAL